MRIVQRFLPSFNRAAIVAVNQLPVTKETLLLRLLGRGATQQQAINEVIALADDDPQRPEILRLLVSWKINIETVVDALEEDRQLMVTFTEAYQALVERERELQRQIKEGLQQGLQQGLREGLLAGIEIGLELKFGEAGLQLLPEISQIEDVETLRAIKDGLKTAKSTTELQTIYQPTDSGEE